MTPAQITARARTYGTAFDFKTPPEAWLDGFRAALAVVTELLVEEEYEETGELFKAVQEHDLRKLVEAARAAKLNAPVDSFEPCAHCDPADARVEICRAVKGEGR
jgi:hypothetical protein